MKYLLTRFEHELFDNPALVDTILQRPDVFPPVPSEPRVVPIRCDKASIDLAVARAAALAVCGTECLSELVNE